MTATGCRKCGRDHQGESMYDTNRCNKCGQEGHNGRSCANKRVEGSGKCIGVDHIENDHVTPMETGA